MMACLACMYRLHAQATFIKHLDDKTGLPQNSIKGLAMDRMGYLWIGTEMGISRYDGHNLKNYDLAELKSSRVGVVIRDSTNQCVKVLVSTGEIVNIGDGRILSIDTSKAGYGKRISDFPAGFIFRDSLGLEHFIGRGTHNSDVYDDNGLELHIYKPKPNSVICPLGNSLYYIDSDFSILPLASTIGNKTLKENKTSFYCPSNANAGNFALVVRDKQVFLLRMVNNKLEVSLLLDRIPFDEKVIHSLYDPLKQLLCLGTATDGLHIFRINTSFSIAGGTRGIAINAHILLDKDNVYSNGQIFSQNGIKNTIVDYDPSIIASYIAFRDHHGDILFNDFRKGITRYDTETGLSRIILPYQRITGISEDRHKQLWICDEEQGLLVFDNSTRDLRLVKQMKELNNVNGVVFEDEKRHGFWIMAGDSVIYWLNANLELSDSFILRSRSVMRSIFLAQNGHLWVTTYGDGIYRLSGHQFIQMPFDRMEYIRHAHCIMEDSLHHFWISTNRGLFRLRRQELDAYIPGKPDPGYYYFNYSDGLVSNEFNGSCFPCANRDTDGSLSFPSMKGVVYFNPERTGIQNITHPLLVDEILCDGKIAALNDTIQIGNGVHRVTFNTSMPYWGNAENLHISYMIEGFDKTWQNLPEVNSVSYTDISSGLHRIVFRVRDLENSSLYHYTVIYLDVEKKFYQTWWFILLMCIAFAGLAILYSGVRNRLLQKKNRELEAAVGERSKELVQSNDKLEKNNMLLEKKQDSLNKSILLKDKAMSVFSHNIIGPIKYISLVTDAISKNEIEAEKRYLEDINITSKNLLIQSIELLNWLNTQKEQYKVVLKTCNIYRLCEEKCRLFAPIANYKGVQIINAVPDDAEHEIDEQLFGVILYNLLDNAIKYSRHGEIRIQLKEEQLKWVLIVEDTGVGMSAETLERFRSPAGMRVSEIKSPDDESYGLGWNIILDCLKLLKADYDIKSSVGMGTGVSLFFRKHTGNGSLPDDIH
jgi:signal transduction histidine kinase